MPTRQLITSLILIAAFVVTVEAGTKKPPGKAPQEPIDKMLATIRKGDPKGLIVGRTEQRYQKFHKVREYSHTQADNVLHPLAFRGPQLACVNEVMERGRRDLNDAGNGRFGDLLAQE